MRGGILGMWVLVALSRPAAAQPAAVVDLTWTAPAGCPDEAEFRARVGEHLRREPAVGPAERRVDVTARADADGHWVVRVESHAPDGDGERELTGDSCAEVADAAALVVALIILDTEEAAPPAPASAPAPPPAPPEPAATARAAAPRPPSGRSMALGVRAAGLADAGVLPGLAPGVAIGGLLMGRSWRLEALATFWPEQHAGLAADPAAGADIGLLAGGVRGCAALPLIELCAGAELGVMSGRGVGVTDARTASARWLAATAGLARSWNVSRSLTIRTQLDAVIPYARPSFVVEATEVHVPAPVAARATLGLELRF